MTIALGAVLVLTATVCSAAVGGDFQFDDYADVVENDAARASTFVAALPTTVRPLLKATYALQDAIHGAWAPGFHLINVALHLIATTLVFLIVRRAASLTGRADGEGLALAFLSAGVWAVHPAVTESVSYVSGRSGVLSGVLVLAAVAAATGQRPRMVLAFLCALLAPLARETALILPAIHLWWQLTIDRSDLLRRAVPVGIGTAIAAAIILLMPRHQSYLSFSLGARDPFEALRLNIPAVIDIAGLWLMPWRVSIDPAPSIVLGWTEPAMLWRLAAIVGAAGIAIGLRRRAPLIAFAIGLTLLAIAPSNSFIWRTDPVGLRPLYLAAIGLSILLALALLALRKAAIPLGFVAMIGLGVQTWQRALLYRDAVALWQDAVVKAPDEARPRFALGYAYLAENQLAEAEESIRAGLARSPGSVEGRNALALVQQLRAMP